MERHLSTGVSTIVALMSAYRAVAEGLPPVFLQKEIDRIETYLHEDPLPRHLVADRYRRSAASERP